MRVRSCELHQVCVHGVNLIIDLEVTHQYHKYHKYVVPISAVIYTDTTAG